VLHHSFRQNSALLLLQLTADNLLQLGHLGSSRVKERKHDVDFLRREPRAERAEAEGYQGSLGLAKEVSGSPCLADLGILELFQSLLSNDKLLPLPLGKPFLPVCQFCHLGVQVTLLDVSNKLVSCDLEVGIL
jgi:hypothetical protein